MRMCVAIVFLAGYMRGLKKLMACFRPQVPGLQDVVKPPELLAPLLKQEKADLYQSAFFVGPVGVVSTCFSMSFQRSTSGRLDTVRPSASPL